MKRFFLLLLALSASFALLRAQTVRNVNQASFFQDANLTITTVACTLSDGTTTTCYQITTNSVPADHDMGPWCPDNISDGADAGGIWLEDGTVYDVDGDFIANLATFYNDNTWLMYDSNGDIYVTETEDDCINAANPNVGEEYANFCVQCLPSYITDLSQTWVIPITPVLQEEPTFYDSAPGGGGGPGGGGPGGGGPGGGGPPVDGGTDTSIPSTRGLALNGIEFSAPAPVDNILSAYTIAPFDDAGGHINVNQGYHYHAATGMSHSVAQDDGHGALIGYAMDGNGIYARLDESGNESTDLDDCRGHSDATRGYHYHIDAAGNNNFINCLQGAYVVEYGEAVEMVDNDNDGFNSDVDCDDNDASVGASQTAGTACDDGDATTENDVILADGCSCAGTTIDPCADSNGDADNDGICADDDCDDNDANVGAKQTAGTACDDGDATTENDVILADGCSCAGTTIDPCADSNGDADNDGICADDDCDDNDANVGAKQTAGTTCDDGIATTENDVIQADGCSCAGTTIVVDACANNGGDADNDGICAEDDCDDNDANVGTKQTAGTACDDGVATTENDVIQADGCSCAGTTIVTGSCTPPTDVTFSGSGNRVIKLSWTAVTNASTYTIQIRFKGTERWIVTANVRFNRVTVYGPQRDYEYRIKSNCADGESAYGPIGEFSIPTTGLVNEFADSREKGEEILIKEVGSIYPNPVNNRLNLSFTTTTDNTDFLIYDNTGKQVFQQRLVVGADYYNFSLDHLNAGLYIGIVRENGEITFSERIVKQ